MLDLNTLKNKYLTIKLLDGREIELRKPNDELYLKIEEFQNVDLNNSKEVLEETIKLTIDILNRNKQKEVFTELDEEYDLSIRTAIIKEYIAFTKDIDENPN